MEGTVLSRSTEQTTDDGRDEKSLVQLDVQKIALLLVRVIGLALLGPADIPLLLTIYGSESSFHLTV
jgi:hypothetical protein